MIDQIKKLVFATYKPSEVRGIFLSAFDNQSLLISSNGTLEPEKNLDQLIDLLYHGLIEKEKNVKTIVVDVILESSQEADIQQLQALNLQENGLCLIGENG
jgi:hypothetical protein